MRTPKFTTKGGTTVERPKVTVLLHPQLHAILKHRAKSVGCSLSDCTADLIAAALKWKAA